MFNVKYPDRPISRSRVSKIATYRGVSQRLVFRVLKDEKYYPFQIQLHQEIKEDD